MDDKKGLLVQKRSHSILAIAQTVINGMLVCGIGILYLVRPTALQGIPQVEVLAGLGIFGLLYYFSLHRLVRRLHQGTSTLILTLITTANIALLILQTGGIDSPFYSLWLLAIITSGVFGAVYTGVTLAATVAVHAYVLSQNNFSSVFFWNHVPQLVVSFAAAAIAELVYHRGTANQKQVVASLSGQLGEEQLKAQVLLSSMADGVIVVDQEKKIQLINQAAQTMSGWDEQSAKGLDYRLVLKLHNAADKEVTDINDPFMDSWSKNASVVHNDLSLATKTDERKIALSISISPIYNPQKEITGGIAVFRDISQQKEVERTRNEFVSTASHEMRTPVAAIEGYIALAMNPKISTIDDRAMGYLQKAHDNTQHLGALFRDLLSVTKIDEGLIAKNLAPVNLTQMLQDIAADMQFAAAKKNLSVTFMNTGDGEKTIVPNYWVSVDMERMREVIMNLIENGMKFTKEGGITLAISGDDKTTTVKVQDTGIGIPAEDIGHLFQKFYRVDNSATRTIGGTGLGLYLCRTLIELFNGRIWVESEFGKGSSFNFTLPRIEEPAAAAAPATAPQPATAAPSTTVSATGAVKPEPLPIAAYNAAPTPTTVAQPQVAPAAPVTAAPAPIVDSVVAPIAPSAPMVPAAPVKVTVGRS